MLSSESWVVPVSAPHWPAEVSDSVLQMSRYTKTELSQPGQGSWDETIHNPQTPNKKFRQEFAEMLFFNKSSIKL